MLQIKAWFRSFLSWATERWAQFVLCPPMYSLSILSYYQWCNFTEIFLYSPLLFSLNWCLLKVFPFSPRHCDAKTLLQWTLKLCASRAVHGVTYRFIYSLKRKITDKDTGHQLYVCNSSVWYYSTALSTTVIREVLWYSINGCFAVKCRRRLLVEHPVPVASWPAGQTEGQSCQNSWKAISFLLVLWQWCFGK